MKMKRWKKKIGKVLSLRRRKRSKEFGEMFHLGGLALDSAALATTFALEHSLDLFCNRLDICLKGRRKKM